MITAGRGKCPGWTTACSGLAWFPCSAGGFDWVNYGRDKTWPAPQGWTDDGHWAGPPDPVLVSGLYSARLENAGPAAAITMTSGSDPRTGLRISRRVELFPVAVIPA